MAVEVLVTPNPLTVGQRVRIARFARGWRQIELAVAAKVPPSCVSALERGIPIYGKARRRILAALGLEDPQ